MTAISEARPYTELAQAYDGALGFPIFERTRQVFEALIRQFRFQFRDAADIGCGTGLFCLYLARRWRVPVVGVDLSRAMLRVAEHRCRGNPVRLFQQDMSYLRLPSPVDLITCNFDAINHITDPRRVRETFRRVFENLRPGGHFMFDALTPCQRLPSDRIYRYRSCKADRQLEQEISWNPASRLLRVAVWMRRPGSRLVVRECHHERMYDPRELIEWLCAAKFRIRHVSDVSDVALKRLPRCAPRAVVLAQRQ